MSNFNWQTEDDVVWDDETMGTATAVFPRRPWLTFLIIIIAIVTAATLIYRQVDERVETATGNAESDILASHRLLQQAGNISIKCGKDLRGFHQASSLAK